MKAFGIFKGGGVKGLAHVGAYKAARDRGVEFTGVAGTSAGAIVASLIAVGYSPEELYREGADSKPPAKPFNKPFTDFFEARMWDRLKRCRDTLAELLSYLFQSPCASKNPFKKLTAYVAVMHLAFRLPTLLMSRNKRQSMHIWLTVGLLAAAGVGAAIFTTTSLIGKIILLVLVTAALLITATPFMCRRYRALFREVPLVVNPMIEARGLFPSAEFSKWLGDLLKNKIAGSGDEGAVLFKDIKGRMPLKIIATNVSDKRVEVFSQDRTPEVAIVDAVAASMSIPIFFKPHRITFPDRECDCVDGGMISNTPAWALDDERINSGMGTPTLVFNLEERRNTTVFQVAPDSAVFVFAQFLLALMITVLEGGESLQFRQVGNLHMLPLKVDVTTLQLGLDERQRDALWRQGFTSANDCLDRLIGPVDPDQMEKVILKSCYDAVLKTLSHEGSHLRVCVLLRICTSTDERSDCKRYVLKVCYSYNMHDDADDTIELPFGAGGAGKCWNERINVYLDMQDARKNHAEKHRIDKYQQALVRPTLKGLICCPVFGNTSGEENVESNLIAVLAFDTDDEAIASCLMRAADVDHSDDDTIALRSSLTTCGIIVSKFLTK